MVLYVSFGFLLAGPLAFGAVEPWAIFALELVSAALLAIWAIQQAASGELGIERNALFAPMLAFAGVIGLQLIDRAKRLSLPDPLGRRALRRLRSVLFSSGAGDASYAADQGPGDRPHVVRFCRGNFRLDPGDGLERKAILAQDATFRGLDLWPLCESQPLCRAHGNAGCPVPVVYALTRGARGPRRALAATAAAIMACTIFLSGSRGGMVAFAVQMALLAAILASDRLHRKKAVLLGSFLVVVAVLLAWMGGGELARRMASIHSETHQELSGGMRFNIDRDSLHMFLRRPGLGWGLGNFPEAYPQFRTFYTTFFVNEAHNDYLQLLVETGVAGFAVMLWYLVVLYRNALKKLNDWAHDTNGAVTLACILGCTGILVHSFVDFNLQVPANALLFYVLAVVAAMKDRFSHPRRKNGPGHGAIIEIPVMD